MMIRTFLLALFFCAFGGSLVQAQDQLPSLTDSMRIAFSQPPRFFAKASTRNAFITGRPVRTYGLKVGTAFGDRVSIGLAYHWMGHGETYLFNNQGIEEVRELRLAYVAAFFEYSFVYQKHWELTLPVSLGVGRSSVLLPPSGDQQQGNRVNASAIILYEPGMILEYRFLKYFGAGAGMGLRIMLKNNREIKEQFTAPIWELRFRIRLGEMYRDLIEGNY